METKTEINKSQNQNVEQFLTDSIKQNTTTGEIPLEKIEKATGLERADVVKQLRAFKGEGIYVVGRKSHKSRYLWGQAKETYKAGVHSYPKHQIKPKASETVSNGNAYSLQVQIGEGEKFNIPVRLELVH